MDKFKNQQSVTDDTILKERQSKRYYEDLYKEEREKNLELQKQLKVNK